MTNRSFAAWRVVHCAIMAGAVTLAAAISAEIAGLAAAPVTMLVALALPLLRLFAHEFRTEGVAALLVTLLAWMWIRNGEKGWTGIRCVTSGVVLGVPSNDFNQESADNAAIREFCDGQFGIEFPMAALSHVRGPQAIPLFRWLAARGGGEPRWNFHKYLVARDGRAVRSFATRVEPESAEMLTALEAALSAAA